MAHEKAVKDLKNIIAEVERQKEAAMREVAELKVQLKMIEETRDVIRRDLIDANRAIREGDEARDLMRCETHACIMLTTDLSLTVRSALLCTCVRADVIFVVV